MIREQASKKLVSSVGIFVFAIFATTPLAAVAAAPSDLTSKAQQFNQWFEEAAAEFDVPVELLQAIAFVESRWDHRPPVEDPNEHGMPPPYGIMGLHDDEYFGHSLREAAQLIGRTPDELKLDPQLNIRGAAALLSRYGGGKTRAQIDDWEDAAARLSGIPQRDVSQMHTYDVFNSIKLGRSSKNYYIDRHEVDLRAIYGGEQLKLLSAPRITLSPEPKTAHTGESTSQSVDYGPALWDPAASCNYTAGRSSAVTHVAIHIAQGHYATTISWFRNCNPPRVSAHYVIRSSDGQVTQMVRESDTAHHVGDDNTYTIGIEHEGFAEVFPNDCARWYSDALYNASARLVRDIADSHGIDKNGTYDDSEGVGTVLPRNSRWKIKGHTNFPTSKPCPGECWNWPRFRGLVILQADVADARIFDAQFYLNSHTDLRTAFGANNVTAATRHWIDYGLREGRVSSVAFHPGYYLALYPDLRNAFGPQNYEAALHHWLRHGISEGRESAPAFNVRYYLNREADLRAAFGSNNYDAAVQHWNQYGIFEGRRGSNQFDPVYYLNRNPDVAAYVGPTNYKGGLTHWYAYGRSEGRVAAP